MTSPGALVAFDSMWSDLVDIGRDPVRGGYSRHLFDDGDLALRQWFVTAAERQGLDVERDRNGNMWAWWGTPGPNAVVTGSHLDSVPGGGAFDGPLGVVSGLLAIEQLRARGFTPSRPVAVVVMAEEEGGRFGLPCLGSRLLTGAADPDRVRALVDRDGVSFTDAAQRAGLDPQHIGADPERLAQIGTFIELHVEQGRLMHVQNPQAAVGVGSSIVAHGRWRITIDGAGNHAGTTALNDRRDPMVVAANAVLAVRQAAAGHDGAVATVGRINPIPGGTNVIASQVQLWLDARYGGVHDTDLLTASILARIRQHALNEGCQMEVAQESLSPDVHFDADLRDQLTTITGGPAIPTGAGHDAGIFAEHVPSGMLYVRNPTGISHAPGEFAETDDCIAGVVALADVIAALAGNEEGK